MTNCLNCGAPFDVGEEKCAYCGTSYYDLSAIDLDSCKPFMLKIKVKMGGTDCFITQLVRPLPSCEMEMATDTVDITDGCGVSIAAYASNRTVTTNLSFAAVPRQNGSLVEIVRKEN